jgi:hypothetical protein
MRFKFKTDGAPPHALMLYLDKRLQAGFRQEITVMVKMRPNAAKRNAA